MSLPIKTRFAPSPTGFLHAGNYRTAVFSYLVAKQHGGVFVLRIEDTDRARSKKEYEDSIIESLTWLGLSWDKFCQQSEQGTAHKNAINTLLENGNAYVSQEAPREGGGRSEVIRFRNPGGVISFTDVIRGEVSIDVGDLGDFVIAKSLDEPVFHLAVVVDDAAAGITHVIRGEDHISNTPRQILIQRALGVATPIYAHLPLILNDNRSKLSKRKGAKALTEYRAMGIMPEAMLNYLALLGWHPKGEREFFSRDELVKLFSLERVQKAGAIFDEIKLLSINQHWMRGLSDEEYLVRGDFNTSNKTRLEKAIPLLKERSQTFEEARNMLSSELVCLFNDVSLSRDILCAKEPKGKSGTTRTHLEYLMKLIGKLQENTEIETIRNEIMPYADKEGRGEVLWPLRYVLSGEKKSPDPFTLIAILGKKESLLRLTRALVILNA